MNKRGLKAGIMSRKPIVPDFPDEVSAVLAAMDKAASAWRTVNSV